MDNTYYHEMLAAQREASRLKKEKEELLKEKYLLQKQLQELINEIIEEQTTSEDDCSCGGNCGCKGDNDIEITVS